MISVYMICQNEQAHIERALRSVTWADEIVVVDSGSTDETLSIARRYTERVYHHDWQNEGSQRAYALSLCSHDWVLCLDADEEVSDELRAEMVALVTGQDAKKTQISEKISEKISNQISALEIPFHETYLGTPASLHTQMVRHIRFFRKSCCEYDTSNPVHVSLLVRSGRVARSRGVIRHFSAKSVATLVAKTNRYSGFAAQQKHARGKRHSTLKLVTIFPLAFVKSYLYRRDCCNGKTGFVVAMINAFYAFLKEAKLYEIDKKDI